MINVDFEKICRDVLDDLKLENSDEKKSNLVEAFQKSTVYICAEVLKRYHTALYKN